MNKFRLTINILATAIFMLAVASIAQAQATRTWVSGVGDDANPCSRTAPCKTFAGAISKTATGGEINALDPGGFGAVTITKAITIDGGGGQVASILAAGTNGVVINAASTSVVLLRNLRINGIRQSTSPGVDGVKFIAGRALIVENCDIFGWGSNGINVALTASVPGNQNVSIKNCNIDNNGGAGVLVSNSAAGVIVTLENVRSDHNSQGFKASTNCVAFLSNSTFNFNAAGVQTATGTQSVDVDTCYMAGNGDGIQASAGTTRISNCRISANNNGINFTGGAVQSFGDNKVQGNFSNNQLGGSVTSVPAPVKI